MSEHKNSYITIVTGLPRSGTSMMMQVLLAGGMPLETDGLRLADKDNPKGYFELEVVKNLPMSNSFEWLEGLRGKAVKMVFLLLYHLPEHFDYKIIMMQRNLNEVLMSQRIMLEHNGKTQTVSDNHLKNIYRRELERFESWMKQQSNLSVLHINYRKLLLTPLPYMEKINRFLDQELNIVRMVEAVDISLYRCRYQQGKFIDKRI